MPNMIHRISETQSIVLQARVSPQTATPIIATVISALTAGIFALTVDLEALADLVSVGTLSVFLMVSLACLWRRFVPHGEAPSIAIAIKLSAMTIISIALSANFSAKGPDILTAGLCGACCNLRHCVG
jgi:basic amino acid/polyamine antiporter, APA family